MGRVIKQSLFNALSNYLGVIVGALNLLILYPRAFSEETEFFGLIQLILSYSLVVANFTNLGIPRIIIKYFPHHNQKDRSSLLFFTLIYPLPVFFLLTLFFLGFQDSILPILNDDPIFLNNWSYIIPISIVTVYFEILASVAISFRKTQVPLFIKEVIKRLLTTVLIILYWVNAIDVQLFLTLYTLLMLLQVGVLLSYLLKKKYFGLSRSLNRVSLRPMMAYGGFLFLTSGVNFLVNKIDLLMIGSFLDLETVAYYSVAFFIGGILAVPGKSLMRTTQPILAKAFAENRMNEVEKIYRSGSLNLMIIGALFFTLLITNTRDLLFLLPEQYRGAEVVILFIALAQLVNASGGQNGEVLALSNYFKFNLWSLLLLLVMAIVNNILLIPSMGIEGAALATLISLALFNLVKAIYIKVKLDMLPLSLRALRLIPVFVLAFVVGHFADFSINPILQIALRSLIVLAVFLPLTYWLGISEDINRLIRKGIAYVAR